MITPQPGPDESDRPVYAAPDVTVVGTFAELTQVKAFNAADGASFFGVPEGNLS